MASARPVPGRGELDRELPGEPGATGASDGVPSLWDEILGDAVEHTEIDPDVPHPIRMWDYMIGGKDNYESDRHAVRHVLKYWPDVMLIARAVEAFAQRSSAWIAEGRGLDQFLQMGAAIPIMNSFDGIVRTTVPDARYVYVTDDPITAAHARGVLAARAPSDRLHVMRAEFRDPGRVLAQPWLRERLDLDRPLGVLLLGMLDYTRDDARLRRGIEEVMAAVAPGSLVVVLQYLDFPDPRVGDMVQSLLGDNKAEFTTRSMRRIHAVVDGFEFVPPGLVRITSWRPDGHGPGPDLEERCHIVGGAMIKR